MQIIDRSAFSNITSVSIKNFKSVKSVTLTDCRRINVLIGRPNVGKSNILEALALFDVPYMINTSTKSLKNLIRVENTANLFHNGISNSPAEINIGDNSIKIVRGINNGVSEEIETQGQSARYSFSPSLRPHFL